MVDHDGMAWIHLKLSAPHIAFLSMIDCFGQLNNQTTVSRSRVVVVDWQ
jgi:hypothetical protein